MKNIVIFEPLCRGFEHVPFNVALISSIREAFPESRFVLIGIEFY